jgi:outer membrane cobalamin receptor
MRALFITCIVAIVAVSATSGDAQETDTAELGAVVVSASKIPKPASTLTQPVTVISGEELRARGVLDIPRC